MALLTNLRVRVESDPMRVPLAASMQLGQTDSFANVLERAVAERQQAVAEPERAAAEPADEAQAEAAEPTEVATDEVTELPVTLPTDQNATPDSAPLLDLEQAAAQASPLANGPTEAPAPAPSPAKPRSAEPLVAAFVANGAAASSRATVAVPTNPAIGGVGGAKAGTATARGADGALPRSAVPTRANTVAAGYRTSSTTSAQLLEQSRDSVFKQILMKLSGDGGEMRMRLEPPDLGELDLRMLVENGNRVTLSIAAERHDVAQLLQQHLDALKQTLQAAGLDVADAQVTTRDQRRRQTDRDHSDTPGDRDDALPAVPSVSPRHGGYLSAEGLDFWV